VLPEWFLEKRFIRKGYPARFGYNTLPELGGINKQAKIQYCDNAG
jgi:hypothetical protein